MYYYKYNGRILSRERPFDPHSVAVVERFQVVSFLDSSYRDDYVIGKIYYVLHLHYKDVLPLDNNEGFAQALLKEE